jgi:hypothetical protein
LKSVKFSDDHRKKFKSTVTEFLKGIMNTRDIEVAKSLFADFERICKDLKAKRMGIMLEWNKANHQSLEERKKDEDDDVKRPPSKRQKKE